MLINQSHTYKDLFLPIDQTEQRLFDGIDGSCSIGEIVRRAKVPIHMARNFFEKLWLYDQVVFDTSLCREREEGT